MLMHAAMMLQAMANPGAPSSRTKNMPELSSALKGRKGTNQYMYSSTSGMRRSELPSSRAAPGF